MNGFKHQISRRRFSGGISAGAAFPIVPRHGLGGKGYTAPSEKTTLACIGMGGQEFCQGCLTAFPKLIQ